MALTEILHGARIDLAQLARGTLTDDVGTMCVTHVHALRDALKQEHPVLSLAEMKTVQILLDATIAFAVQPCLVPGVGLPVSKRSRIPQATQHVPHGSEERLDVCVQGFLGLIEDSRIRSLVSRRYLCDLLASLFQLLRSSPSPPTPPPSSPAALVDLSLSVAGVDEEERWVRCREGLHRLVSCMPSECMVHALMTLLQQQSAPTWLKKMSGHWLSRIVVRPDGVRAVFHAMLEMVSEGDTWALERAASVVGTKPVHTSPEEYCDIISSQIFALFHAPPQVGKDRHMLLQGAVLVATKLLDTYPEAARRSLVEPVLGPLRLDDEFHQDGIGAPLLSGDDLAWAVVVPEDIITQSVEDLHKLLIGTVPSQTLLSSLCSVIPFLFRLYCLTTRTRSNVRAACREIMACYLRLEEPSKVVSVLKHIVLSLRAETEGILDFAPGGTGGVVVRRVGFVEREAEWEAHCLVDLLHEMKHSNVPGDLFLDLLGAFVSMRQDVERALGECECENGDMEMLSHTLATLTEQLGPSVLRNTSQTIRTLANILVSNDTETLTMALGVLSGVLSGSMEGTAEDEALLQDLVPRLQELTRSEDTAITDMALSLETNISMRSFVGSQGGTTAPSETLDDALTSLRDPLPPVRAHGLVLLRRLVLEREPYVMANAEHVFDVLFAQLRDSDMILFLSAIQGLGALGDVFPGRVIPRLAQEFRNEHMPEEVCARMGEVMMKVARRCGEVLPVHAHHFVRAFLHGAHDKRVGVRTSSLSNLGTLCEVLRYAVHPFITDILACTEPLLLRDKEEVVRRAAAFVYVQLVDGFRDDVLHAIPEHLRQAYNVLKQAAAQDPDEFVRGHARVASRWLCCTAVKISCWSPCNAPDTSACSKLRGIRVHAQLRWSLPFPMLVWVHQTCLRRPQQGVCPDGPGVES